MILANEPPTGSQYELFTYKRKHEWYDWFKSRNNAKI